MLNGSHYKIRSYSTNFEWNFDHLGLTIAVPAFRLEIEVGIKRDHSRVGHTVILVAFDAVFRQDIACLFTFQVKQLSEFRVIYSNESD